MNDWEIQLKKGLLEFIILGILNNKKIYGRDLIDLLNRNGIETSEGTIYPLLAKLKMKNYVTSKLEESTEGPVRKYYIITEVGIKRFEDLKDQYDQFNKKIFKLIKS